MMVSNAHSWRLSNPSGHSLLKLLNAERGIVCLVGAGGKKTLMSYLSSLHPGFVGITTTTHMRMIHNENIYVVVLDKNKAPTGNLSIKNTSRITGFVNNQRKINYYTGVDPETVTRVYESAELDLCLVKADGARGRLIKSAADYEPVLPAYFHTFIPVVSVRATGRPLTEKIAHRPALISRITGLEIGEIITPCHIAKLMTHPEGLLRGAGSAMVVPVITMVDDNKLLDDASEIADIALGLTDRFDRVVLFSLKKSGLVAVVNRQPE